MPKVELPPLVMQAATGYAAPADDPGPFATVALGDLGGLTQFGVRIETLPPGSASSMRHWHSAEDEFVWILVGHLTLIEDTGETVLGPGEAAAFPAGRRNGHCLVNRTRQPATFLVAGWRDGEDVCTYSGRNRLCVKSGGIPRFTRRDGTPLAPEEETGSFEDPAPQGPGGVIDIAALPERTGASYPEPWGTMMNGRHIRRLGDAKGLTQFGASLVTIDPGRLSSLRHWHAREDEFVLMLEGRLTLIEDAGETSLKPGDMTAHPAGVPNGHHMRNDTGLPARFLVLGTCSPEETCDYPGIDLLAHTAGARAWYATRDGRVLKEL